MLTIQDVHSNGAYCKHYGDIPEGTLTIIALSGCYCNPFNPNGDTCNSYCDTAAFAIGLDPAGKFIVIHEWSDTTGHGCQCDGTMSTHENFKSAYMLGLTDEHRHALQKYIVSPEPTV